MGAQVSRQSVPGLPEPDTRERAAVEGVDVAAVGRLADLGRELRRRRLRPDDLDADVAVDANEVAPFHERGDRIGSRAAGEVQHRLARVRMRPDKVSAQSQWLLGRVKVPPRVFGRRRLELDEVDRHSSFPPTLPRRPGPRHPQQTRAATRQPSPFCPGPGSHLRVIPGPSPREDHDLLEAAHRPSARAVEGTEHALPPVPPPSKPPRPRRDHPEGEPAAGVDRHHAVFCQDAIDLLPQRIPWEPAIPRRVSGVVRRIPEHQVHRADRDRADRLQAVRLDDLIQHLALAIPL